MASPESASGAQCARRCAEFSRTGGFGNGDQDTASKMTIKTLTFVLLARYPMSLALVQYMKHNHNVCSKLYDAQLGQKIAINLTFSLILHKQNTETSESNGQGWPCGHFFSVLFFFLSKWLF